MSVISLVARDHVHLAAHDGGHVGGLVLEANDVDAGRRKACDTGVVGGAAPRCGTLAHQVRGAADGYRLRRGHEGRDS